MTRSPALDLVDRRRALLLAGELADVDGASGSAARWRRSCSIPSRISISPKALGGSSSTPLLAQPDPQPAARGPQVAVEVAGDEAQLVFRNLLHGGGSTRRRLGRAGARGGRGSARGRSPNFHRADDEAPRFDLRHEIRSRRYANTAPRPSRLGRNSSNGTPSRCASGGSNGTRYLSEPSASRRSSTSRWRRRRPGVASGARASRGNRRHGGRTAGRSDNPPCSTSASMRAIQAPTPSG